ncbi:MAG: gliding motility-associated C-terminal domain-containing protein [Spirochaetales bacterium]|nr:gliding motility-associated C-terminal domain-containing protein [Spirochaetales bacterium]
MKKILILLMVVSFVFAMCKSTDQTATESSLGNPMLTEPNPNDPLYTDNMAFSPNGDGKQDTIKVIPNLQDTEGVSKYELRIKDAKGNTVKQMSGDLKGLKTYSWDGKDDNGKLLPEGMYVAEITLINASGEKKVINSNYFNLDNSPPEVAMLLAPLPFSPDGDGVADTLTLTLTANDISPAASWDVKIKDANKKLFHTLKGKDTVPAQKTWNGYSANGTQVKSASTYTVEFSVIDRAGNAASTLAELPIDILVFKVGSKRKLFVRSITFKAYKTSFSNINTGEVKDVVRWIANILKKNPSYNLIVEGHALNIYENKPDKYQEEEAVLIPLSKQRAKIIKDLIVAEGIDADRITIQGLGSSEPIVAPSDASNRWKNRRVEFLLVK